MRNLDYVRTSLSGARGRDAAEEFAMRRVFERILRSRADRDRRGGRKARGRRVGPSPERLEPRDVKHGSLSFTPITHQLLIVGSAADDRAEVHINNRGTPNPFDDLVHA